MAEVLSNDIDEKTQMYPVESADAERCICWDRVAPRDKDISESKKKSYEAIVETRIPQDHNGTLSVGMIVRIKQYEQRCLTSTKSELCR
jgi:hypothetical protein